MKLDKENTKIWLDALRSGKYEQGKDWLRTTDEGVDKFCCLGVACDVLLGGGWHSWHRCHGQWSFQDMSAILSADSIDKLGLSRGRAGYLMRMNDQLGYSFAEIADVIEGWMNNETE